jgi:hypothetical protein
MPNSLVKTEELKSQIKAKELLSKLFLGLGFLLIVVFVVVAVLLVKSKTKLNYEMANLVNVVSDYEVANRDLDVELQKFKNKESAYELDTFLPVGESLTDLTRVFDRLFEAWNQPDSPMINNNLSFGQVSKNKELELSILPVTLNITSSKANFQRLLALVESSGTPGSALRAMDIQSISLNLSSDDNNTAAGQITYTVTLNAYFRL